MLHDKNTANEDVEIPAYSYTTLCPVRNLTFADFILRHAL